jgi:hypothetical protein
MVLTWISDRIMTEKFYIIQALVKPTDDHTFLLTALAEFFKLSILSTTKNPIDEVQIKNKVIII